MQKLKFKTNRPSVQTKVKYLSYFHKQPPTVSWSGVDMECKYLPYLFVHKRGWAGGSVTRSGDLLDFGHLFKAFGNN